MITQLLAKYGQGGPCSNTDSGLCYHNSYIIADSTTAWVLETVGKHWVALQVTSGFKNISNELTITTKFDRHSDGLLDYVKEKDLWDGEVLKIIIFYDELRLIFNLFKGDFNFAKAFSGDKKLGSDRLEAGEKLLTKFTSSNSFKETDMFNILRDTDSNICRPCTADFPTQGSQVQIITKFITFFLVLSPLWI